MGPLDPPMVTAQGYNDPQQTVGASTSPLDQNALLANMLRKRNAAALQAQMSQGSAQQYGSMFQNPHFQETIRGTNGQPDLVQANWGDILGKGISNYMAGKERKQALTSTDEVNQINTDFMNSTLQNDPQAQKLYGAVQAGVPGAGQALSAHLAPKKQSMAILVQGLTSGLLSEDMAAKLAEQEGIDPNVARSAAVYAAKKKAEQADAQFSGKSAIEKQKIEGKQELQNTKPTASGYTAEELAAMPVQERIAAIRATSGKETTEDKIKAKNKIAAQQNLPKTQYAMDNINRAIDLAKNGDFWPGNGGLKADKLTTNKNNVNLRQAIYQLTLDANNGSLGTGFSNADRDFLMAAQANLESGNSATVQYQLSQLLNRLKQKQEGFQRDAGSPAAPVTSNAHSGPSFDEAFPPGTFPGE